MTTAKVSLNDRFDLEKSPVLLNGTQALVRLMLMQKARDRAAGLNTAGYVTGYRGSPLGAVDMQMRRAGKVLAEHDVQFQEGLNEDLAATAIWGAQQAELRGEGKFDGVFGLWYGKGPGVDRSGDVFRHANMAGTSPLGGVVAALGDDQRQVYADEMKEYFENMKKGWLGITQGPRAETQAHNANIDKLISALNKMVSTLQ